MSNEQAHINILCRYHNGRRFLFERALTSLREQTHKRWNLIISYETQNDLEELRQILGGEILYATLIQVTPQREVGQYFYNLYLNELKKQVVSGWVLCYDSDNFFVSKTALSDLAKLLDKPTEIHIIQFVRKRPKPNDNQIEQKILKSGFCDSASICFHSDHKFEGDFLPLDNGDYFFIQEMLSKLPSQWHKLQVVCSDRRSRGK
jgi:hypothetical protein